MSSVPRIEDPSGSSVSTLESAIEAVMQPGQFISSRSARYFVDQLEEVAAAIRLLADIGHADDATQLFETFLAAAYQKAEDLEDFGGIYDRFVGDLYCMWMRARRASNANTKETAEILLEWMVADEYGFCYQLEQDIVKVLNARELEAFVQQVRSRLDVAPPDDRGSAGYPRRRWTAVLKGIFAAQGDVDDYIVLADETGMTAVDCSVIAEILQRRSDLVGALTWVERGLELASKERFSVPAVELKNRQRAILKSLGRLDEVLALAWTDFERGPSLFTFETLMRSVPEKDRSAWYERAMAQAENGALSPVLGLLAETGEIERLAERIASATDDALEGVTHYCTQPAAELLADAHPALAARTYRALGLRILNAKKSKYYPAALEHFERARDCYLRAGQQAEWEALVSTVRSSHGRKYAFMPGFERVAKGGSAVEDGPSFLDQAWSRWRERRTR